MFLIIAGGGNVGYHLLKHQLAQSNEVVIIEEDPARCSSISDELGNLVINGDACDPAVLETAGIARAEMIVSSTEKDQDNLVICQIAKKKFHVPYTIALANDPSNLDIFRKLGVDAAVSAIDAILNRIEQNIAKKEAISVISKEGDLIITKTKITNKSVIVGSKLGKISLPEGCKTIAVIRNGKVLDLFSDFELKGSDVLINSISKGSFLSFKSIFSGIKDLDSGL